MHMGTIVALLSAFFGGIASMLMKKISQTYDDNYLALVYQYIAMSLVAILLAGARSFFYHTAYFPSLSILQRGGILLLGIIGYAGIALLFASYDRIAGGVALIVANLATFFMYFANVLLFPGSESLTKEKLILSVLFFGVIGLFLREGEKKDEQKKGAQHA